MMNFINCKIEEEKQRLRDDMLNSIYYQTIATRNDVAEIKKRIERMEQKLVYVGATPEERKYLNIDGSINYDAINDTCDHVLELFGNKYIKDKDENNEIDIDEN